MTKAYYDTLQIEPGATRDDIREAYLRLAKAHHPDLNGGQDPDGRFLAISNAYQALCRCEEEEEEEAAERATRAIQIEVPLPTIFTGGCHVSPLMLRERCPVCTGNGEIGKRICPACDGRGYHPLHGDIRVDIPQHCPEGEVLQGHFTCPQRPDTFVPLSVIDASHPAFRRVGLDIRARLVVPRKAARQGGRLAIEGPAGGRLEFPLPPNSRTGDQISIRGAGTPHRNGSNRGDLILDIVVERRKLLGGLLLSFADTLRSGISGNRKARPGPDFIA